MGIINKHKLLAGIDLREEVIINNEGDTVIIKPLSNLQWAHVNEVRTKGLKINSRGEIDGTGDLVSKNNIKAQNLVIKYGLVEPSLTEQEINNLNPVLAERIASKILEITGLKPQDTQNTFPTEKDIKEVEEEVKQFR